MAICAVMSACGATGCCAVFQRQSAAGSAQQCSGGADAVRPRNQLGAADVRSRRDTRPAGDADPAAGDNRPASGADDTSKSAGAGVLALSARFGKDLPAVNAGVVWRVYSDKPDANGVFQLVREERGATPNIVLAPGGYVVHASLGLVSAVRPVTLRQETLRESFELPAGGLRIEGRVGSSKIPQGQITFSLYKGSQFEVGERAPIAQSVAAGDVLLVPEGVYYIISNYGDANSVVRSDIRVQVSKLTDVTVTSPCRCHHPEACQR